MAQQALSRATYLVVLGDYLIQKDISDTIVDHDPGATVITATSAAEAILALTGVVEIAVAFVEASPDDFASSDLARAVEVRTGRVVLLGDDAEEKEPMTCWPVLRRPFRSVDVQRHLGGE